MMVRRTPFRPLRRHHDGQRLLCGSSTPRMEPSNCELKAKHVEAMHVEAKHVKAGNGELEAKHAEAKHVKAGNGEIEAGNGEIEAKRAEVCKQHS